MPHPRAFRLCFEKQRQDERENPELLLSGHTPAFAVYPNGSYAARLQLHAVLLPRPVIGVDPHSLIYSALFDNLGILSALRCNRKIVPDEFQSLGDYRG